MTPILLNPGPINVSPRVRAAANRGDACHREPEVAESLARTRALLLRLFDPNDDYAAAFFTGSGTAALEAAVIAAPSATGRVLVLDNGVYGARIAAIAHAHRIPVETLSSPWDKAPDLAALEERLAREPAIEVVAMVHHETTTGLINPVAEVGRIARAHRCAFVLDTVSGLGGEPIDLAAAGVDVAASTANKCIGGLPGLSFVLVRRAALERFAENPRRSLYFDLKMNLEAQAESCGAFTPAVQILWALEAALEELAEEGVPARHARFQRVSDTLRQGFGELGLTMLLPPALRSRTITALNLPEGLSYDALHGALKQRGFIIYAGQGPLRSRAFRVANMGQVSDDDYARFLSALKEALP